MNVQPEQVGLTIQLLRKQKDMTQQQLAERLHISPQAVSKWEAGRALPDTALLLPMAGILECTVDVLLNGGNYIMKREKRVEVSDVQRGINEMAHLGDLIGRDNTVYQGMVEGINRRMNIDVEEMLDDASLKECLTAEILIQAMAHGSYVDITQVKSRFKHQKWIDEVCKRAAAMGMA